MYRLHWTPPYTEDPPNGHHFFAVTGEEFAALQDFLAVKVDQRKQAKEPESIEVGQVWMLDEILYEITGLVDTESIMAGGEPNGHSKSVLVQPLEARPSAFGPWRYTEDQFRANFKRLPFRREVAE